MYATSIFLPLCVSETSESESTETAMVIIES